MIDRAMTPKAADQRYLGVGAGLGVQLDGDGRLAAIVRDARCYPLVETGELRWSLVHEPVHAERLVVPRPGQVAMPHQLTYAFVAGMARRTLRIDLAANSVVIEFTHVDSSTDLGLGVPGQDAPATDTGGSALFRSAASGHGGRVDLAVTAAHAELRATPSGVAVCAHSSTEITITVRPVSLFEQAFVIAGDAETAAVLSSCFHDPGRYLPVFLVDPHGPVPTDQQFAIDRYRRATGATHFVFGNVAPAVREAFTWDKSDDFQARCRTYGSAESIHRDPVLAALPELRCPRRSLPAGLLRARRARHRLVIDDTAAPLPTPRRPAADVISYERHGTHGIVAANLAFHRGAELVESAATPVDVATINATVRRLEGVAVNQQPELTGHVHGLRELIRGAAGLDLTSASTLTAFTTGIPYGAAYDLPTGQVLDAGADHVVLRELMVADATATAPARIALFVDTGEFGPSELAEPAAHVAGNDMLVLLHEQAATKLETLGMMHVLPIDLQVIVAHGTGADERLDGIMLHDGLVTAADLRLFGRVPVVSELVLNNACATWSSLAPAFHRWSGGAYIGTLWPVPDRHARRLGRAVLADRTASSNAETLYRAAAALPVASRCNYVLAGTALHGPTRRDAAVPQATALVTTLAFVEAQFQRALSAADERALPVLAAMIDTVRTGLHHESLDHDPSLRPFLLHFEAATATVARRRGLDVDAAGSHRAAVAALRALADDPDLPEDERAALDAHRFGCAQALLNELLASHDLAGAEEVANTIAADAAQSPAPNARAAALIALVAVAEARGQWQAVQDLLAEAAAAGVVQADPTELLVEPSAPVSAARALTTARSAATVIRNLDVSLEDGAAGLFIQAERLRDDGRVEEAFRAYERCRHIYQECGDPIRTAKVLNNTGILFRMVGDNDRAAEYFDSALELKTRFGADVGNTLMHLGDLAVSEDPGRADEHYRRAEQEFRSRQNRRGLAEVLLQRGRLEHQLGRYDTAREVLEESRCTAGEVRSWVVHGAATVRLGITTCRLTGGLDGLSAVVEGLRVLDLAGVQVAEAVEAREIVAFHSWLWSPDAHDGSLPAARELLGVPTVRRLVADAAHSHGVRGDLRAARAVLAVEPTVLDDDPRLAALARELRPPQDSVAHWTRQLHALDEAGQPQAAAAHQLGLAYRDAGDRASAVASLRRSGQLFQLAGETERAAAVQVDLGSVLLDDGAIAEARAAYEDALASYRALTGDERVMIARIHNNLGYCVRAAGDIDEAFEHYASAIRVLGDHTDPVGVLARVNEAELAAQTGDLDRAEHAFRMVVDATTTVAGGATGMARQRWRAGAAVNTLALLAARSAPADAPRYAGIACRAAVDTGDQQLCAAVGAALTKLFDDAGGFRIEVEVRAGLLRAAQLTAAGDPAGAVWAEVVALLHDDAHDGAADLLREAQLATGETIELASAILRVAPRSIGARLARGAALADAARWDEAEAEFRHCAEQQPTIPAPWQYLASMALRRADPATAVAHAHRATEVAPDSPRSWELTGLALHANGQPTAAIAALRTAADLYTDRRDLGRIRDLILQLEINAAQPPPFPS